MTADRADPDAPRRPRGAASAAAARRLLLGLSVADARSSLLVDVGARRRRRSSSSDFLTEPAVVQPGDRAGIEPALVGTLWLMVVCAVFIVPVGVATAIYLEEYADRDEVVEPR